MSNTTEPTVNKKLLRQWIVGVLSEGKAINRKNAIVAVNKSKEIIEFMEKHNVLNPLIK